MILPILFPHRFAVLILSGALLLIMTACAPEQVTVQNTVIPTPLLTVTATVSCEQTLVAPAIMEIQPPEPIAGREVTVIGSGGYIQDTCGGYFEGAREFKLYMDHEPVGDLVCYVNRCEGKLALPGTLAIGQHCLSMAADTCEFEFQVVTK
jgi:hypothetical protein